MATGLVLGGSMERDMQAWRWWRLGLILVLAAGVIVPAQVGSAQPEAGLDPVGGGHGEAPLSEDGYVLHSDGSTGAVYAGDGSELFRYNPTGEVITVSRSGVGSYSVDVGAPAVLVPTVTASTDAAHRCKVSSVAQPGSVVEIICFDSDGAAVDSSFTMRWTISLEDATALVSADGSVAFANNPWGAALTAVKDGVGSYVVATPGGPNFEDGHVQVTGRGPDANVCTVASLDTESTRVLCFDSAGNPADSGFTFLRIGSDDDAHVWADDPLSTSSYTPDPRYSHNPQGNDPVAQKTGPGRYAVEVPGLLIDVGGSVAVTAYSSVAVSCSVVSWDDVAGVVDVSCTDASGAPVDAEFGLLVTRFRLCEGVPANVEIGNNAPTAGDDVIIGTAGNDVIKGLDGNDRVCALGGDDFILGNDGDDVIFAGPGDDEVGGNAGDDTIFAGSGDDVVFAGSGDDVLHGSTGEDLLGGGSGFDTIFGEEDNDRISGGSNTDGVVHGGPGDDAVNGGSGNDYLVDGGIGHDTVSGNGGIDEITGGEGDDDVRGGPGNDRVRGGPGNDFVAGNEGRDTCDGEAGVDTAASNCEMTFNIP